MLSTGVQDFRIALGILGGIGTVTNLATLSALWFVRIGSEFTRILLRSQCIFDGYSCFIMLLYQMVGSQIKTGSPIADEILCYIWADVNLFWPGYILGVQNNVCISLDRLLAVLCPVKYKLHKFSLKIGVCLYLSISTVFLFIPNFFLRKYVDGECLFDLPKNGSIMEFNQASEIIWFLMNYLLPVTFIPVSHAVILYYARPTRIGAPVVETECVSRSLRKFTYTTVFMAITLLCSHSVDEFVYLLATLNLSNYIPGSLLHDLGLVLIMIGTCTLPLVMVATIKSVRNFMWESTKFLFLQCKWKKPVFEEHSSTIEP
ncbi:hypothetical protein T265_03786 [Opisthorchis viverrini]|uniref:G-protein coupled receptors family 1 profile domain-containing protein n=1 Tax=Opisthorchis viverrini TaxID=6198 RepID=A0A074ZR41_OPIVI|nr:hypothetical protein T265_03786 [Opisthorchis viverrini]KER29581.1 hypothetical protein T265_03786 [Opisthorchis viverrini]